MQSSKLKKLLHAYLVQEEASTFKKLEITEP